MQELLKFGLVNNHLPPIRKSLDSAISTTLHAIFGYTLQLAYEPNQSVCALPRNATYHVIDLFLGFIFIHKNIDS